MNASGIQGKIYAGYAKTAARLGFATEVFRPTGPLAALAPTNFVTTLLASFNAEDMHYRKANKYAHPTWFCVADGRRLKVGDLLVSEQDGTFFVAAMQSMLPILTVQTNTTVSVFRVADDNAVGALPYAGPTANNLEPLMTEWPASVLQGSKGEKNEAALPADTRAALWNVLLPYAGVTLRASDILTDHLGRRFALQSCELTDLGWRLTARQELA